MNTPENNDSELEQFPVEPRFHPVNRIARGVYDKLASAKLAMLLLVAILISCLCGALLFKDMDARQIIFGSLWFNGLLVLLVVNTACCFFGRMWGRRLTVVSFGMILFHLSFVSMFLAIVFNSLFCFNGTLRLTEGETLSNRDPNSYDFPKHGLFFSYSRLKGETTLVRVHRGYKVDGSDKLIAFDVAVADGQKKKEGTIYINNKFSYRSVDYLRDREGYSLLAVVSGKQGNELFGMYIPLQSFKQKDDSYLYATGVMAGPGPIDFPPEGAKSLFRLQLDYLTDNQKDRNGRIRFRVWPLPKGGAEGTMNPAAGGVAAGMGGGHAMNPSGAGAMDPSKAHAGNPGASGAMGAGGAAGSSATHAGMPAVAGPGKEPIADGTMGVGGKFAFGEYQLVAPEVRYWVAMTVRYNPGKPIVLASLWVGLAGIIITTIGRMAKRRR